MGNVMDFSLTEQQKMLQRAVREFAAGEFTKEIALEHELEHKFPFDLLRKAAKLGFVGVHYAEKYGGQGLGALEDVLITEELCRRDSGLGICIVLADFACGMIKWCGSEEQKQKYLPKVISGQWISAGAFTEPDHGSDITRMSTTASRVGGEYVINGTKTFITNGEIADFAIVLCQTEPDVKPAYRGQSTILVEKDGFKATDVGNKMGLKMMKTSELSFDDTRVPIENLVGQETKGFYQTLEFFDESRIEIAAQALGTAQGAFDRALDYAKQREQFGRKIVEFQVTQHKFADMATKIETARLLTYKAAWSYDQARRIDPKLTSMAKMYAARVAVEVTEEAVQILGGYGYITEYELERFYRDARITEIYDGTREIQKNTIASALIGKIN